MGVGGVISPKRYLSCNNKELLLLLLLSLTHVQTNKQTGSNNRKPAYYM